MAVTAISSLAAWPGLRAADAAGLPMPWLRRLDGGPRVPVARRAFWVTSVSSILFGLAAAATLHFASVPALPGGPVARALSTLFAAGPLEIVLHLFIMSALVWLTRRRWIGIIGAAAALVAFHLGDAGQASAALLAATILGNGALGLVLGVFYAAYGFEFVMLGHAIAHLITLLLH